VVALVEELRDSGLWPAAVPALVLIECLRDAARDGAANPQSALALAAATSPPAARGPQALRE
jgi:hypothetical protein